MRQIPFSTTLLILLFSVFNSNPEDASDVRQSFVIKSIPWKYIQLSCPLDSCFLIYLYCFIAVVARATFR